MTLLEMPIRRKSSRNGRVKAAPAGGRRPRPVAASPDESADDDRGFEYRLTVDQYHRMIEAAVLEEGIPVELLDGQLVWKDRSAQGEDPMTVGQDHIWGVQTFTNLQAKFGRKGSLVRIQQPVTLPPHHEPEPDVCIAAGNQDTYYGRNPRADGILCLVEVSDSSLTYDRTTKLRIYANAGVAMYVIVNLPDRVIEVYTRPVVGKGRYATVVTLSPKDKITFPTATGKGLTVQVKSLLPPSTSKPA